ncbi:D-Ala-D-Ala carboxypeptidase family metallohydrolase [Salinisphaera sp. T31B1]|uniref:D-Ala-D-Ala carboxypeptidase family metallohydrolase n=1 Tax=Salinisphaera sp. T31B1 TaxID=727963 RepID=UPI00333F4C71
MSRPRATRTALATSLVLALWLAAAAGAHAQRLSMTRALDGTLFGGEPGFAVRIGERALQGPVNAVFVMPGTSVTLRVTDVPTAADLSLATYGFGPPPRRLGDAWRWQVPRTPGLYPISLRNRATGGEMRINVFVKTPFDARESQLNGYDIGRYEPTARARDPHSAPPRGLVEVTPTNASVAVSPHFSLGDFLCHQQPEHWPKYVLIRPALLDKLEHIRGALIAAGVAPNAVVIMSGYRTPWYNADIGNTTVYSQHLFGSAADIFVDADADGEMDDLDADGAITLADAEWLADLVETVTATEPDLAGGLSAYPGNAYHGPFVHIDVRGQAVRW